MTDRDLMQQALEALEGNCTNPAADPEQAANEDAAITALRERLAQPEQKPVAWRWKERINNDFDSWVISASEPPPYAIEQQPLYTSPPKREWVGLTDQEINSVCYKRDWTAPWTDLAFARAIEQALKEKNHG